MQNQKVVQETVGYNVKIPTEVYQDLEDLKNYNRRVLKKKTPIKDLLLQYIIKGIKAEKDELEAKKRGFSFTD